MTRVRVVVGAVLGFLLALGTAAVICHDTGQSLACSWPLWVFAGPPVGVAAILDGTR